jgi:hypothetical protein
MRSLIFILLVFLVPIVSFGQKEINLKKKYFGSYSGQIPGYKMDIGDEVIDVAPTDILIQIEKNEITLAIGGRYLKGTYYIMFKAQKYFLLDADIEGQLASERIMVYKRGKRLRRDGMYPQPVSELRKK